MRTLGWALLALAMLALVLPPLASGGTPSTFAARSFPPFTLVNYTSSVDGFALSYDEWLPTNFSSAVPHPLIVYFHGQQATNGVWVSGGLTNDLVLALGTPSTPSGKAVVSLLNSTTRNGYIFMALNSRSGAGWYINSPCGGPQHQDVLDAIAHEKAREKVRGVYLLGESMGTLGVLYTASLNPSAYQALGIVSPVTDEFEDLSYREYVKAHFNRSDPWAYDSIQGKANNFCGALPGTRNATQLSVARMYQNMSPLRFNTSAFANLPIYVVTGGVDNRTPNNVSLWPTWMQVNNTFVNSTCNVASRWGEPANCTTTMNQLHLKFGNLTYRFRFIYIALAPHGIQSLNAADLLRFWGTPTSRGGFFTSNFPPTIFTPNTKLVY